MKKRLLIINPNSTQSVTDEISRAVEGLREPGFSIECRTLTEGPPGILTQCDVDLVVAPLIKTVRGRLGEFDGIVVACYSDPGVNSLREMLDVPVFGAARATLGYAATISTSVGVISLKSASVARHNAQARANGLADVLAGDRPADISVADLGEDAVVGKLIRVARDLIEKDGADILILGCCGMSRFAARIAEETGITVLDPSQVSAAMARTAMLGGHRT
jgi:Asp/Glu/hydantoin racemase